MYIEVKIAMVGIFPAMALFCVISTYFRISCPVTLRNEILGGYDS